MNYLEKYHMKETWGTVKKIWSFTCDSLLQNVKIYFKTISLIRTKLNCLCCKIIFNE